MHIHNPPKEIEQESDRFTTVICQSELERLMLEGAGRVLIAALDLEVAKYVEHFERQRDELGHRLVVRNGYTEPRALQSGLGTLKLRAPRVNDRREGERFISQILPPYLRRTPTLESLIPILYLKGISTSAMAEALAPLLGSNAAGLSAASIVRLIQGWQQEYEAWCKRRLDDEEIVYIWADGIYCNVRLTDDRPCLLVVVGARRDGTKVLLAIEDGERESKQSWSALLRGLKRRGLKAPPKVAVGDGALGFWAALEEIWPSCRQQRCWVHKTVNVLDKLPKKVQPQAKELLHEIWMAKTKKDAVEAFDHFLAVFGAKYEKACACLAEDREDLLAFYDFPAGHWRHLRTSNIIESGFATIRHRSRQTKGSGSRRAALALTYRLGIECEKCWRKLNGHEMLTKLITGVRFVDGVEEKNKAA